MFSLIRPRYAPLARFERLSDDLFNARVWPSSFSVEDHIFTNSTHNIDGFRPRMDVKTSPDSNIVTATFELPGLQREDIVIDLQQGRLTVSGESSTGDSREEAGYAVRERRSGKFSRVLQLPFGTKPEDVTAKMENGLLRVTFPKTTPEQEPHRISIQ